MTLLEVVIAVGIGFLIFRLALGAVRAFAAPVDEPDPDAVIEVEMDYRCSTCGTRVTMTHAAGSEVAAPRHCREEMEAVP